MRKKPSPLAHGVDYIRGAMKMALGLPMDWACFLPQRYDHAIAKSVIPRKSGLFQHITDSTESSCARAATKVICRMRTGDRISSSPVDCTQRPVFVISVGHTRQRALEYAETRIRGLELEVE